MERHHDRLRGRIVNNLDEKRFNVRQSVVKEFFDAREEIFRKFPNMPFNNICNLDETGLQAAAGKKKRVYVAPGTRRTHRRNITCRFSPTALLTIFADGSTMPPLFVVKGRERDPTWKKDADLHQVFVDGEMTKTQITHQDNAWMGSAVFLNHFLQPLTVVIMQVLKHFKDKATKAHMRLHKSRLIKEKELIILLFEFLVVDSSGLISQRGSAWTMTEHNILESATVC
eukprot:jgi/Tetstr1/420287/TSEL_001036.t1